MWEARSSDGKTYLQRQSSHMLFESFCPWLPRVWKSVRIAEFLTYYIDFQKMENLCSLKNLNDTTEQVYD